MSIKNFIVDMDGVLWQGETPVAGLAAFFATLRRLEVGFCLATNNATRTAGQYTEKLARLGVAVPAEQIVTSAEATAGYLSRRFPAGTAVYVIGEAGLRQALAAKGFVIDGENPTIVVAGLHKQVCYEELAAATLWIRNGAYFIGTNPDVTFPSERGQLPGAGAILAFLQAATGVEPTVIGKPHPPLFREALRRLGGTPADTVMIGDRLGTDIAGGQAAGMRGILLLSGVSTLEDVARGPVKPTWVYEDLPALTSDLATLVGS